MRAAVAFSVIRRLIIAEPTPTPSTVFKAGNWPNKYNLAHLRS